MAVSSTRHSLVIRQLSSPPSAKTRKNYCWVVTIIILTTIKRTSLNEKCHCSILVESDCCFLFTLATRALSQAKFWRIQWSLSANSPKSRHEIKTFLGFRRFFLYRLSVFSLPQWDLGFLCTRLVQREQMNMYHVFRISKSLSMPAALNPNRESFFSEIFVGDSLCVIDEVVHFKPWCHIYSSCSTVCSVVVLAFFWGWLKETTWLRGHQIRRAIAYRTKWWPWVYIQWCWILIQWRCFWITMFCIAPILIQ